MLRAPACGLFMAGAVAMAAAINASLPALSQPVDEMDRVMMIPGVIVDVGAGVAYVMSPQSAIVAVKVDNGRELWRSSAAEKPLALRGDRLIAQVEPRRASNELTIAALDPRRGGALVASETVALPPDVNATIDDTVESSFAVVPSEDDELLLWQSAQRVLQGILPADGEEALVDGLSQAPDAPAQVQSRAGALRLEVSEDDVTLSSVDRPALDVPEARRVATAGEEPVVDGVPEPRFLSADGRHVMHPERVADDPTWDKYLWTVYERETGNEVGSFRTFESVSPFLVIDQRLIYQTAPFVRRESGEAISEPPKLRGVDLESGTEIWDQPIRDTQYRGPFPP